MTREEDVVRLVAESQSRAWTHWQGVASEWLRREGITLDARAWERFLERGFVQGGCAELSRARWLLSPEGQRFMLVWADWARSTKRWNQK